MLRRGSSFLLCFLLLLACTPSQLVVDASAEQADEEPTQPIPPGPLKIQLGYHYKPPRDGTTAETIAGQASLIVLTKNDEAFRDALRAAGYSRPILQYIRGSEVDGPTTWPGGPCDPNWQPYANHVADQVGAFCNDIHPHEDWFLHNGAGDRLVTSEDDRHFYQMNPGNPGWREYAVRQLKRRIFGDENNPPLGYDGIFFDNVRLDLNQVTRKAENNDGVVREYSSDEAYVEAWRSWLEAVRTGVGSETPIWGNMVAPNAKLDSWKKYLPHIDGVMNEGFMTGYGSIRPSEMDAVLKQADYVIGRGKGFYAVSQGDQDNTTRQGFALASYLLVAQPGTPSYFRYSRSREYPFWWTYDNYTTELGAPLGRRYQVDNGWRRDFERGHVVINQLNRSGSIVVER